MNAVFRLEGERTLAICALGQDGHDRAGLEAVNARMAVAVSALDAAGLRYPLHMLASASDLEQEDYLLLQLAALVRLGPELVTEATGYLGDTSRFVRVSHAARLCHRLGILNEGEAMTAERFKILRERLVIVVPTDDGLDDGAFATGPAVDELMGW